MPRNTPIHKDWFMSGLLLGMTVSVLKTIASIGLAKVGVPIKPYASTAGAMVFAKQPRLGGMLSARNQSNWEKYVGHGADVAFGGVLGTAISYMLTKVPPGNEAIKGAAIGSGISAGTMVLSRMLNLEAAAEMTPQEFASAMGLSALFGAVEGAYFGKFCSQIIAQSHPILVKPVSSKQFEKGRFSVHAPMKVQTKGAR